jgi:hypothetical protein
MHAFFVDGKRKEFKAPWSQLANIPGGGGLRCSTKSE